MDLDSILVHKHTRKELRQYPAILTSHFVNNTPYIFILAYDFLSMVNISMVHSVLEYTVPVWQAIPTYLSNATEWVKKGHST